MKRYLFEASVLFLQLAMFYLFPLTCGPTDAMGMVFLILLSVFFFAVIIGAGSRSPYKFAWPFAVALLFLPSVPIYYNSSALVHSLWYFVISEVGLCISSFLRWAFRRMFQRR